jgi:tetratricopeptide (TPR) repeat protein
MSENNTDSTQPADATKRSSAPTKHSRWRPILISILGLVILLALALFGGFQSGLGVRRSAEATQISQQLSDQYQLALQDIDANRYEAARQRLEYIIQHDSGYPGAAEKLAQVLVWLTVPTATNTPTLTPTPDYSGVESIFARAQQLITAQDWPNALAALDELRKQSQDYKTAEVDSMYYFALRNNGTNLIQQGNLEGGIYYLTLAERFLSPLDSTADSLREGARLYLIGASFWDLDWQQTVKYFNQVANGWPSLWDGTMTAQERYRIASMRYGDQLFAQAKTQSDFCAAARQYANASALGNLDAQSAKNYNQANQACHPPTPTP